MFRKIDDILNRITMYKVALYYLIFLLAAGFILSAMHILSFTYASLLVSVAILLAANWLFNKIFAAMFGVQTNSESALITALILALIITPPAGSILGSGTWFLILASMVAMGSKYALNIKNKHIFNPAAIAVAVTAVAINHSASWWVGTASMLPFVLIGGLLMVRKLRNFSAAFALFAAAFAAMILQSPSLNSAFNTIYHSVVYAPILFFTFIMFTEPLTMPPTIDGKMAYGVLVGLMLAPQTHVGGYYFTPEVALLAGNLFSYVISPKVRQTFVLVEKKQIGAGIYNFVFRPEWRFKFKPGQYMEWTLGHKGTDMRGNRRYFTIASSPSERTVNLGIKFYNEPSSYKKAMLAMQTGDKIVGGQLAGDFTLPKDPKKKLVFVAGGIGITPFRSMLKYLVDKGEKRDIVFLYSTRTEDEIVYEDVLMEAWRDLGVRFVGTLTDVQQPPEGWHGYTGYLNHEIIAREVPDYAERMFYISGSRPMVVGVHDSLSALGVSGRKIKTDFFPGLV